MSIPARAKAKYKRPTNNAQLATYNLYILNNLLNDPLFANISGLINDAIIQNDKFKKAEVAAKSRTRGKAQKRNKVKSDTLILMDQVLAKVQAAGDNDQLNAITIFTRNGFSLKGHNHYVRGELEVKHGKKSGTFWVFHKPLKKPVAYIWMISTDGIHWDLGTYCRKGNDIIEDLVPGTKYFIKTQADTTKGKTAWSQVVEIYCL